jgi:hypothetical protein
MFQALSVDSSKWNLTIKYRKNTAKGTVEKSKKDMPDGLELGLGFIDRIGPPTDEQARHLWGIALQARPLKHRYASCEPCNISFALFLQVRTLYIYTNMISLC